MFLRLFVSSIFQLKNQLNPKKNEAIKIAPVLLFFITFSLSFTVKTIAQQIDISGPAGSGAFGTNVVVLPNGNFAVTDPGYDAPGPVMDVGAVYLYDGATLQIISVLTGSNASDQVGLGSAGSRGIYILANGNFVVRSPLWDNGAAIDAGAVTFCNATTGCEGTVSAANSLVGSSMNERVGSSSAGSGAVLILTNGNYVVNTATWDDPSTGAANVGASTFCSGTAGCTGTISAANSLIGSTAGDSVGSTSSAALNNGNYVVRSPGWINNGLANAGAVTFCSGTTGCTGVVSPTNSLVGSTAADSLGNVTPLSNGNYVVSSSAWDDPSTAAPNVGMARFCSGTSGCSGTISSTNSIVGLTANDQVGIAVTVLTNGNFVIRSRFWDDSSTMKTNVGAATFCSGTTGCTGTISAANSLIGSTADDQISSSAVSALTNDNYVIASPEWDNGMTTNVGAATLCNGTTGCTGTVSSSNSLIGSTANDRVGSLSSISLTNGNYVVRSPLWDDFSTLMPDVGAATFCSGTAGCTGTISASNSLIGSTSGEVIGSGGIAALTNGNYVVHTTGWDNPRSGIPDVGAATFCSGVTGCIGIVSAANSLTGASTGDFSNVFGAGVFALRNGNYVVRSPDWDLSPQKQNVGAVTWCSGTTGCMGMVTGGANSIIGSTTNDRIGESVGEFGSNNGYYYVGSQLWDNPIGIVNARIVTLGNGVTGTTGTVQFALSVMGTTTDGISDFFYDEVRDRLLVGRGASNIVSILKPNLLQTPEFTFSDAVGNNNGIPEPGESLTLTIPLSNNTLNSASGTNLQILGGGSADYGSIAMGESVSRHVSYTVPANTPCGSILTLNFNVNSSLGPTSFTRQLLIGSPMVTFTENFDGITVPAFPNGWTAVSVQNGINFVTSTNNPDTGANSAFALDPTTTGGGTNLTSPSIQIEAQVATISFRNRYDTESNWDGGVLEISINGGTFQDILVAGGSFINGEYNSILGANGVNNPLAGRAAWSGNSNGYITTTAQLPASAAGQNVQFRWRFGADDNTVGQGPNPGWYIDTIKVSGSYNCSTVTRRSPFDFDGDGKTDISIFRPPAAEWWINRSSSTVVAARFGSTTDKITPADFTGDGKADIAFWRPATGEWFILRSEDASFLSFPFGTSGDVPMVGDFDGDGKADPTVFRPSTGEWFVLKSTGGVSITTFGTSGDAPVAADYDGDGKTDIAIYRPSNGQWWIQRSSNNSVYAFQFGSPSDKPVQSDFTGDGKADAAFFRPASGEWFILRSEDYSYFSIPFGTNGDTPAPGDYDGDGKTDLAVFRPSDSNWYIQRTTIGILIQQFGITGDMPVPSAFVP